MTISCFFSFTSLCLYLRKCKKCCNIPRSPPIVQLRYSVKVPTVGACVQLTKHLRAVSALLCVYEGVNSHHGIFPFTSAQNMTYLGYCYAKHVITNVIYLFIQITSHHK